MYIKVPDPHPGRCLNLRPSTDGYGNPNMVRCLGEEAVPHQCWFPETPPRMRHADDTMYEQPTPQPWVAPPNPLPPRPAIP